MVELQDRVRQRLEELGMSRFTAAKIAGLNEHFINDLLIGKKRTVKAENLAKLAKALEATVEWLVAGEPSDALVKESEDFARDHLQIRAWRLIQNRSTEELRRIIATIEAAFPREDGGDK